jgi:DNA-binding GntR family transcriptional regulator
MANASSQTSVQAEPARRQLARHRVREAIRQMILDGANRPGERLIQVQLAKQLGVSRAVVREALMELQAGGWVLNTDNCGAKVTPSDPARLIDAFEMRELMDGLAARRCCQRITVAQLRELHEINDTMDRHFQNGEWREGGQLDRKFHLQLVEIAGNQMLSQVASGFLAITKFVTAEISDPKLPAQHHRHLLDAIASGDSARAEQLAREHVHSNRQNVERALAAGTPLHWLAGGKNESIASSTE